MMSDSVPAPASYCPPNTIRVSVLLDAEASASTSICSEGRSAGNDLFLFFSNDPE